jgi:hypothetical protein
VSRPEAGVARTEREIAAEKAAAFGRAGERLEAALAAAPAPLDTAQYARDWGARPNRQREDPA